MDKLELVINTLGTISVAGIENMQKMLACIQTLKEVQNDKDEREIKDNK